MQNRAFCFDNCAKKTFYIETYQVLADFTKQLHNAVFFTIKIIE